MAEKPKDDASSSFGIESYFGKVDRGPHKGILLLLRVLDTGVGISLQLIAGPFKNLRPLAPQNEFSQVSSMFEQNDLSKLRCCLRLFSGEKLFTHTLASMASKRKKTSLNCFLHPQQ